MEFDDIATEIEDRLFTAEQIHAKVVELAGRIEADYAGRELLMIGVLKGAAPFMNDLAKSLRRHVELDWMAVSSYGQGTKSSGVVRIMKDLDTDISGRHVLIAEDIIDSGLTLSWLKDNLETRGAASVEICALLRKPEALKVDVPARYIGWDIPNRFVVGYGLDYAERYRNLDGIAVLAPHVYS